MILILSNLVKTGETLTIRTCVVDKGSTRIDTEFARRDPASVVAENSWQSHGPFDFETAKPERPKTLVILIIACS